MSKKKRRVTPLPELPEGITAIDTHCHLDMAAYEQECEQVVGRAVQCGVARVITIGIDLPSSQKAVALADQYEGVFASVGIHPHHVAEASDHDYEELKKLALHPKVVAYGEIGMDMVKHYAPEEQQMEHFARQVRIAKEVNLPLIIHDREAHEAVMGVLQKEAPFPAGGVMHCFSGDMDLANKVISLGFYVSIPGVVTFNKAEIMQEVARDLPIESLLIETDGPFLTPVPYRGKRNEPANVLYTAQKIAELRGVTLTEVVRSTTQNAEELFRIPAN